MEITAHLFRQYLRGECDETTARAIGLWLHSQDPAVLDKVMLQLWNEEFPAMPEEESRLLWRQLEMKTGILAVRQEKKVIRVNWLRQRRIVAAAVILLLVAAGGIGVFRLHRGQDIKQQDVTRKSSSTPPPVLQWASIANPGIRQKKIKLEDGSEILLAPHSGVRFRQNFETDRRALYLEGKALFHIAKDQRRPFTVYSGDIATTVLGTVFQVSMDSIRPAVIVTLYQGRVVVRPARPTASWREVYLSPGEQLSYDVQKMSAVVSRHNEHPDASMIHHEDSDTAALHFINTPLAEVFEKLMAHYHQQINYHKADLTHIDFTGTLDGADSLSTMLRVIANMNRLVVVQDEKGFSVRKKTP
jgi:ferric-dicitrate binding protein FerR (iron transport regulator)